MTIEEYPDGTVEAVEKAIAEGCEVVYGSDLTLLLDLDTPESVATYRSRENYLVNRYKVDPRHAQEWPSKSGNLHVVIHLGVTASILERIALQAILGSDANREMLSLGDIRDDHANPIMLFKPASVVSKEKADREAKDAEFEAIFGEPA